MKILKYQLGLIASTCLFLNPGPEALRAGQSVSSTGRIAPAGQMLSPRADHSATLLNDGRVLIAGGLLKNGRFLKTAELYDPQKGSFVATGEMMAGRVGQAAVLLQDGRVLVAGGWTSSGPTASAEWYDPRTGKFSVLPAMTTSRARPTATVLLDGRVLIAGGGHSDREGLKSAELFDPATTRFIPTGDMNVGRIVHTSDLLPDGKVLIAGGMDQNQVTASAEMYDPGSGKFSLVGSMKTARYKHTAGALPDGRVLVAGGSDARDGAGTSAAAECYDPKSGSFFDVSRMVNARYKLPEHAAVLKNGDVLVAGGNAKAELFDWRQNVFHEVSGGTGQPQWYLSETMLPNGDVLLAGGYSKDYQATGQVWLYHAN